jgi:hypothetical protein
MLRVELYDASFVRIGGFLISNRLQGFGSGRYCIAWELLGAYIGVKKAKTGCLGVADVHITIPSKATPYDETILQYQALGLIQ